MSVPHQGPFRLSIDIEPELRRRIEVAAAARDLSVREYVETILAQVIASEIHAERAEEHFNQLERTPVPRLTDQQRLQGLKALAELERLSDQLANEHGVLTPESWELLNASREERTRDRSQTTEE